MQEIKSRIIKDLKYGIQVRSLKYGISDAEFKLIMSELKDEGRVTYEFDLGKLPNGQPSPFYGDVINIRLIK